MTFLSLSASQQLKDRIQDLILDSFKDELYPKAISCIRALRKESIKVHTVSSFSRLIHKLLLKIKFTNLQFLLQGDGS